MKAIKISVDKEIQYQVHEFFEGFPFQMNYLDNLCHLTFAFF